jgi:hypothetical protein
VLDFRKGKYARRLCVGATALLGVRWSQARLRGSQESHCSRFSTTKWAALHLYSTRRPQKSGCSCREQVRGLAYFLDVGFVYYPARIGTGTIYTILSRLLYNFSASLNHTFALFPTPTAVPRRAYVGVSFADLFRSSPLQVAAENPRLRNKCASYTQVRSATMNLHDTKRCWSKTFFSDSKSLHWWHNQLERD